MHKSVELFKTFFKIGAFTFGGGYAMIPLIQKEVVDEKKWMTEQDIMDVVAVAETTPGPIAINAATFVGYKVGGIFGAIAATSGVVLPSFVIILLISFLFQKYMNHPMVVSAFWGIRIAVLALMVKAFLSMVKQCPKNRVSIAVALLGFLAVVFLHINVLWIIGIGALAGIVYVQVKKGVDL